jgi:hypothetical protein
MISLTTETDHFADRQILVEVIRLILSTLIIIMTRNVLLQRQTNEPLVDKINIH